MKRKHTLLTTLLLAAGLAVGAQTNVMKLDFEKSNQVIDKNIYGQFAEHLGRCIYDGIWVGPDSDIPNVNGYRKDVLEALKALKVPVLRWPGGCFADTYQWKHGVGPVNERPKIENIWWGGTVEDNSFGTHEFLNLCEILGADAYVSINVGSATVYDMIEWIEYMTSDSDVEMANWRRRNGREEPWDIKFVGVGNESWGCGGDMTPEHYADLLRQYSIFAKMYGKEKFQRVGCGANSFDLNWTDVVMNKAWRHMDALSVHYYTIATGNFDDKRSATNFGEDLYIGGLYHGRRMEDLISQHTAVMDKYDPEKTLPLLVDEWGIWTDVEPGTEPGHLFQQNSMRDALIAVNTFDIFHRHADRVKMANIAQMVNVLQAMILTKGDQMILTPTYHAFKMYSVHQNATYIPVGIISEDYKVGDMSIAAVSGTASQKDGKVNVSLSNVNPRKSIKVTIDLGTGAVKKVNEGTILAAKAFNSINTFEKPNEIAPKSFNDFKLAKNTLEVTLPPLSIVNLELQ